MESNNNKLKENDIKNFTCYYFEEISNSNHLEFSKKLHMVQSRFLLLLIR